MMTSNSSQLTPRRAALVATTFALALSAPAASAALLVYEGFDYVGTQTTLGTAPAANGGTGWAGAWSGGVTRNSTGLSFGSLDVSGVSYGKDAGANNPISSRQFNDLGANFDEVGETVWFSSLFRMDALPTSGGSNIRFLSDGNINSGFGYAITASGIQARVNQSTNVGSAQSINVGQTYLLVGQITRTASGYNYSLFMDPSVGASTPGVAAFATGTNVAPAVGSSFYYAGGTNLAMDNSFDEIRIGTTYADVVTAIPEPSAFAALAGLGAIGLAATRRRRVRA